MKAIKPILSILVGAVIGVFAAGCGGSGTTGVAPTARTKERLAQFVVTSRGFQAGLSVGGAQAATRARAKTLSRGDEGSGGGSGEPGGEEPGGNRPRRDFSRFVLDAGGGVGLAFLSGQMSYAEQFINATTRAPECGNFTCYRNIDPGFAATGFVSANLRVNVTQRVGLALGMRFQFDTADWEVQPPGGRGPTKSNPFANLLLYGRVYYAFTPNGFARQGLVGSAFVGGGAGQIEPKPGVPASARYPSAHVVSGFGNFHVGARIEYGFRAGFHVGAELALHFMFPTFLFNVDVNPFVGFHF